MNILNTEDTTSLFQLRLVEMNLNDCKYVSYEPGKLLHFKENINSSANCIL